MLMISRINHIGVAVSSIEAALKTYTGVLGLKLEAIEVLPEHGVKTAVIRVGESRIEFMEPLGSDSPIARFIQKKGEGLHHLGLEVANIKKTLLDLKAQGVALIDQEPRTGAGNSRVAFLHPRDTTILVELIEPEKPV
jgi:methylmalonyl-CoA/ethylmalonyl-CoA epimerase